MASFLDYDGLLYFWGKLKAKFAAKATTLSGYGITDAKITSGTITLGSNTITPLTSSSSLNAANLGDSGATAGSYGLDDNASPAHGGTFKVPYVTVNAKGIVTAVAENEITLPASGNTDTKVTQTLTTGNAEYALLAMNTASASANKTEASRFAQTVTLNPSIATITAKGFKGAPISYGECSTAAGTAAKTVSTGTNTFNLATGAEVIVKFANTNTAANPTLAVNGTTAKAIYYKGSAINKAYLVAGTFFKFVYDGSYWELVGEIAENSGVSAGTYKSVTVDAKGRVTAGANPTTLSGYGITDAYTKTEIDGKLTSAMHYKGSVAAVANLPSSNNVVGDFYNVTATGDNYAWYDDGNGNSGWDFVGNGVQVQSISNGEIDTVVAT